MGEFFEKECELLSTPTMYATQKEQMLGATSLREHRLHGSLNEFSYSPY